MWLLINLSKKYTTKITYSIIFLDIPQDKILQEKPVEEIEILVKGNGFKLFVTNFLNNKIVFSLDRLKKKNKTDFYLLTSEQNKELQQKLTSGLELIKIIQDTIHFKLRTLTTKKVPIVPDLDLTYKLGYAAENITLEPDSIMISGSELQLNEIEKLKTKNEYFQEISKSFEVDLPIAELKNDESIKKSHEQVKVKIQIDKFTEGNFEIPIEIINTPDNLKLNIFPKKVKVTYKVGLKNYDKITGDLFEVICDYKKIKEDNPNYLIPELKKVPELISSVRISPQRIDFLIQN